MKNKKRKKTVNKRKLLKRLKNKKDKEWAIAVKDLYFNKCAVCGETKRLNAHHIIPRELQEFRHELVNGIALCPKHHWFSFELSPHRNPFEFFIWWINKYPNQYEQLSNKLTYQRELKK